MNRERNRRLEAVRSNSRVWSLFADLFLNSLRAPDGGQACPQLSALDRGKGARPGDQILRSPVFYPEKDFIVDKTEVV